VAGNQNVIEVFYSALFVRAGQLLFMSGSVSDSLSVSPFGTSLSAFLLLDKAHSELQSCHTILQMTNFERSKAHNLYNYNTARQISRGCEMALFPEFKVERLTNGGTLADRVCDSLIQLINSDDFPAGTRLPSEMSMASRFGVSRTVIREAVSRLKSEGMVESRQGSGVFVRKGNLDSPFRFDRNVMASMQSVRQVVEVRQALEGEIAALAAVRRTKAQLAAVKQAVKRIDEDVAKGSDGVDADIVFHRRIAEACGNPHFVALVEFLFNVLRRATQITRAIEATKVELAQQVREEHRAIVEALVAQDPEAARAAARLHMERACARLASLDDDGALRRFVDNPSEEIAFPG
jgi:GntR family transcriptional repressor for pyruvate dehydrogenase complex